jgi:DNA-binding NarL/FixJ family response regulator
MSTKTEITPPPVAAPTLPPVAASVLIIDDHAIFRADARELLETAGYKVVGEAANAADGIQESQRLRPDAVLLDVQLPDRDGFAAAEEIVKQPHPPRIVLISSREAADYGNRVRTSAAAGFIHKPDLSRALVASLIGPPD